MSNRVVPIGDEFPDYDGKVYIQDDCVDDIHEVIREESLPDLVDAVRETEYDRIAAQLSNMPSVMRSNPEPKVAKLSSLAEKEGESANARRVRLWRERNRDRWLEKNRQYVADARKKKSKVRKYILEERK